MPMNSRKYKARASHKQIVRKAGKTLRAVDGITYAVANPREIRARNAKLGHAIEVYRSTDTTRKKAAQLGFAYTKIYNRERDDIDLIAAGLSRFKK